LPAAWKSVPATAATTAPSLKVLSNCPLTLVTAKVVVVAALAITPPLKVFNALQVLAVVVPNARLSVGVEPPVDWSGYVAVSEVTPVLVIVS
jgi:hypothetical protein